MMRIVGSFEEVRDCINRIRSLRKGFLTNFFPEPRKVQIWCTHHVLSVWESEETAIFMKNDDGFTSVMYCSTNSEELFSGLLRLPQNNVYVVDQIIDARTDKTLLDKFAEVGYKVRKCLVRMSKVNTEPLYSDSQIVFYADDNDIPELMDLLQTKFDKYSEQLPTSEEIKDFIDAQHILIHRIRNKIAGFIIYDKTPSTLYLRYWLVNEEFRNQGVGSALFREFSRRGNECKRHMLWVMEDNDNAIVRYKHYGYIEENMKNYVLTFNLN